MPPPGIKMAPLALEPEPYTERKPDSGSHWAEEVITGAAPPPAGKATGGAKTKQPAASAVGAQPSRADQVRMQRLQQIRQLKPRHDTFSAVEEERRIAHVPIPAVLTTSAVRSEPIQGTPMAAGGDDVVAKIQALFPSTAGASAVALVPGPAVDTSVSLRIGCVLSGGQASGGHNVISGLFGAYPVPCTRYYRALPTHASPLTLTGSSPPRLAQDQRNRPRHCTHRLPRRPARHLLRCDCDTLPRPYPHKRIGPPAT